jgi:hemolysin D
VGRAIALSIAAFVALAIAWACIGKIDIVAVAQGRIVPSGRVKVIQPFISGVVRKISVEEGQHVHQGELLVELDSTNAAADTEHLTQDLIASQIDVARLQATIDGAKTPSFAVPAGADPTLVETEKALMLSQLAQQQGKLDALDREKDKQKAAAAEAQAQIGKLSATLPLLGQRVDIYRQLSAKQLVAKVSYLELEQQQAEMEGELAAAKARLVEAKSALASVDRQRAEAEAEFVSARLGELSQAQQKMAGLGSDLIKAQKRQTYQHLSAPIDGTVQQLAIHTIGGVVQPAQSLMVIVPDSDRIEIEAQILNQDIGFVREGQNAVVKLEAFPFTRYGTIPARVVTLAHDASNDKKGAPVYVGRLRLLVSNILVDGQKVALTPGMAATIEIDTGKRRLIEYVLSPLIKASTESMKER